MIGVILRNRNYSGGIRAPPLTMQKSKRKSSAADSLAVLATVALCMFVIGSLYFARDILIPLALAALLTFLLSPLVARIERWVGRIVAVVSLVFAGAGAAGWVFTRQLVDLATELPEYQENIVAKHRSLRPAQGGRLTKISEAVEELKREMPGGANAEAAATATRCAGTPENLVTLLAVEALPLAVPVKVIEMSDAHPLALIEAVDRRGGGRCPARIVGSGAASQYRTEPARNDRGSRHAPGLGWECGGNRHRCSAAGAVPSPLPCLPVRSATLWLARCSRNCSSGTAAKPRRAPRKVAAGELVVHVEKSGASAVCISLVAPSTVIHARYVCLKMRAQFPGLKIIVGLWGAAEGRADAVRRLRDSGADEAAATLTEAVAQMTRLCGAVQPG